MGASPQYTSGGQNSGTSSSLTIDPAVLNQLQGALAGSTAGTQNANTALQGAYNGYQTDFSAFNPSGVGLNNNFAAPDFGGGLDAISQNLVSAGQGQIAGQRAAQNQNIAQQFGGSNPALAGILQAQGNNQSQLAGNGLNFQAALAQYQRQGQQYQLGQQAQALGNQSVLSQQGFNNNQMLQRAGLEQAGNQALSQQADFKNAQQANNQNLLSALGAYANLTGTQNGTGSQTQNASWTHLFSGGQM